MSDAPVWIVHRDPRLRGALARLAGAAAGTVLVSPDEPALAEAAAPRVLVLGVEPPGEAELELAHRVLQRAPDARLVLIGTPGDRAGLLPLFDRPGVRWLDFPPTAVDLRSAVREAARSARPPGLSARRARDVLAERFGRYFDDLDLPELLRAVAPELADVPLLIRGEPGTGRRVLARYVHAVGPYAGCSFVEVPCGEADSPSRLRALLHETLREQADTGLCLLDAERLPGGTQRALASWIEFSAGSGRPLRWIATVADDVFGVAGSALEPELARALGRLSLRIPPLRERTTAVVPFARATLLAWCRARGRSLRQLSEAAEVALVGESWPGNFAELEAAVLRAAAHHEADPLEPVHLGLQAPPEAGTTSRDHEAPSGASAPPESADREAADVGPDPDALRTLSAALAHEVRNPLTSIRTFAQLLPERAEDERFRADFRAQVEQDVVRIERVLERIDDFAGLGTPEEARPVDVNGLLRERLRLLHDEIEARRLLVLEELDPTLPPALVGYEPLRFAIELLLARALAWIPERGDLYVATRTEASLRDEGYGLCVLIRFFRPGARAARLELRPEAHALELLLARTVVEQQGGRFRADASGDDEMTWQLDLPTQGE